MLNEWEKTVHDHIDSRIQQLRAKNINKCKKHVFKDNLHLDYLQNFHNKFVLVFKAVNNVRNIGRHIELGIAYTW